MYNYNGLVTVGNLIKAFYLFFLWFKTGLISFLTFRIFLKHRDMIASTLVCRK